MESDIMEQLREEGFVTHMARLPRESKILHAAADEIERLRLENEVQRRTILRLEAQYGVLLEQRDEARREVCNNEANHLPTMADPRMEAKRRGWDCFKEVDRDR
jgi:hypothetical protein